MVSYICNGLLYVTSDKKTKMKTNRPTIALSGGFDPPTKGQIAMTNRLTMTTFRVRVI